MNAIYKLSLPSAILAIVVGILVPGIRPIVIPLGVGILIAGYVLERVYFRRVKYATSEMSDRAVIQSVICGSRTDLMVSSRWNLSQADKLSLIDGEYSVKISEKFVDSFSLVSKVTINRSDDQVGKTESDSLRVQVDSGWVLFLLSSNAELFPPKKLRLLIQEELTKLPNHEPLCLWLKDGAGKIVGVVVSTGEGDGSYSIKYQTRGGVLTQIEAVFIGR